MVVTFLIFIFKLTTNTSKSLTCNVCHKMSNIIVDVVISNVAACSPSLRLDFDDSNSKFCLQFYLINLFITYKYSLSNPYLQSQFVHGLVD